MLREGTRTYSYELHYTELDYTEPPAAVFIETNVSFQNILVLAGND